MNTISNKFTRFKQSCHCAICQAAARANRKAGLPRRAAAYSTASLRQLAISPYATTTAFYTSIVACAMTMDSGFKTNRLARWESAIAYERSTIRHLSAEESRIKEKLAERLPLEDDVHDMNRIERAEGLDEQQSLEKTDYEILENDSSVTSAREGSFARRASEPSQDHIVASEEDSELHLEEISDWQKAYKENLCEHGQALELSAPVLGPEQQTENIDPQSIYAPPRLRQLLYSHPWTPKKLRTAEVVTARLVVQLLLHYKLHDMPDPASGTSLGADVEQIDADEDTNEIPIPAKVHQLACSSREELQELNNFLYGEKETLAHIDAFDEHYDDSLPDFVPAYSQDPSGIYHKVIREVNSNIRSSFQKYYAGEVDLQITIANVCNEMLTSSAAPNLHTYNLLLMELPYLTRSTSSSYSFTGSSDDTAHPSLSSSRLSQMASLAKAVGPIVDSIFTALRDARIRPNEITCAAMLNHYTERDDGESFAHLITLMRGQEEGLMLARPTISYDPEGCTTTRLRPKAGQTDKIIQAVTPTPTVAEALINGVLHFVGLKPALEMLESLAHDGWAFDERGLAAIVRRCAHERDWNNGVECWDRMKGLAAAVKSECDMSNTPLPSEVSKNIPRSRSFRLSCTAYRAYIFLCWRCDKREDMRTTVQEAVKKCKYSTKDLLADLEPRERGRAHLWIRSSAPGEEKKGVDRQKASNDALNLHEIADTEQESVNVANKQPSWNESGRESESRQEREQEWEQKQETSIEDPTSSISKPSPSAIAIPIPTTPNPSSATATLLASSLTPENTIHTSSPSTVDPIPDSLAVPAEEYYQHHLRHTPSTPIPEPTDVTTNDYIPTAPLPTISTPQPTPTTTSPAIPSTNAPRSRIPSSPLPQSSTSSALPINLPAPVSAPGPASAPSMCSSSTSPSTTTSNPPFSVQQQPRSSLSLSSSSSSSSILSLPKSPFYNDVVIDVNLNLNSDISDIHDVGPPDIPLVGIIST